MGFQIFSPALRRFAPADGRPLHLCSEPGPRVRCRRSLVRCPIDFRRADPPAPARVSSNGERKRASLADRGCWLRWTSGLRVSCLRSVSATLRALVVEPRVLANATDRACLGLFLFQVCRTPSMCASLAARTAVDHQPPRSRRSLAPHGVGFFAHAAIV